MSSMLLWGRESSVVLFVATYIFSVEVKKPKNPNKNTRNRDQFKYFLKITLTVWKQNLL